MALIALLGALFGGGIWLMASALRPARPLLIDHIRPSESAPGHSPHRASTAGWSSRASIRLAPRLEALGLPGARVRADLRALDRPVEQFLAEQITSALIGLFAPLLMGLALTATHTLDGWTLPLWASVVLAPTAAFVPVLTLRSNAAAWRTEVRHALSSLLDLTAVALAGGTGVSQALHDAADGAHGPAFQLFKRALREAEITRVEPWGPLQDLGQRLGITELDELAGSIALAGSEGARVRDSLTAKAASLRTHLLSEQEALASSATERMSVPVVVLFAGFLILIGFPALAQVLTAL